MCCDSVLINTITLSQQLSQLSILWIMILPMLDSHTHAYLHKANDLSAKSAKFVPGKLYLVVPTPIAIPLMVSL